MVNSDAIEAGRILGKTAREGQEIKDTGFGSEQYGFTQITALEDIKTPNDALEVWKQLIGDAFILGHPVNGRLGTSPYTLGDTDLGARSRVFTAHRNKTYIERFGINRFIDTSNTTATLSPSTFSCIFTDASAQELRTSSIFYDNITSTQVNAITVFLKGQGLSDAIVSVATNSSTFTTVTPGVRKTLTAGNDVRIKVTNGSGGAGWPTAFGTWGSLDAANVTLTELKAVYELA